MRFIFCNKLVYNELGVKDQIETDAVSGDTYKSLLNRLYVDTYISKLSYRTKLIVPNNNNMTFNIGYFLETGVVYYNIYINTANYNMVFTFIVLAAGSGSKFFRYQISSNGSVDFADRTSNVIDSGYSKLITIYSV